MYMRTTKAFSNVATITKATIVVNVKSVYISLLPGILDSLDFTMSIGYTSLISTNYIPGGVK